MPGRPQPVAIFLMGGPDKVGATQLECDLLHLLRLLFDRSLAAMKLQKQSGLLAVAGVRIGIDSAHGGGTQRFTAGNRNARLQRLDHGVNGASHAGKRAGGGRHGFGYRMQLDGHLGDDAQRAFGTDKQARQVIAGSGFARPAGSAYHPRIRSDHGQRQHVLAHGAVAHGIGTRGAGRGHTAQAGIRAGVDRKHQSGMTELFVQRLACHPGLHRGIHVLGVDRQNLIHLRQIDAHAAVNGQDMPFERGAGAVGNHRHAMTATKIHNGYDFLGAVRKHHCIGQGMWVAGLILAVMLAYGSGGAEALAQLLLQGACQRLG